MNHLRTIATAFVLSSVCSLLPRAARAADPSPARPERVERDERFSQKGRVVLPELAGVGTRSALAGVGVTSGLAGLGGVGVGTLQGGGLLSFETTSGESGPNTRSTMTSVSFRPSVDVFVSDRWTLGLSAFASRSTSSYSYLGPGGVPAHDASGYALGAAPRLGRTFDLGAVTLWPKLGVGYAVSRSELMGGRLLTRTLSAVAALDVVIPLNSWLIFDVGPSLAYSHAELEDNHPSTSLGSGSGERLSLGVQAHLGITL